jgi:hypothetical protein
MILGCPLRPEIDRSDKLEPNNRHHRHGSMRRLSIINIVNQEQGPQTHTLPVKNHEIDIELIEKLRDIRPSVLLEQINNAVICIRRRCLSAYG